MTMIFVPGCERRITSDTDSAGLGDRPASNRITSAGVLDTTLNVCARVSVWATTSRSFSRAKILPIPTRKIASESATMMRTGTRLVSVGPGWPMPTGRAIIRSEALEFVFIDDNRYAPSRGILGISPAAALAYHQNVAVRPQNVSRHCYSEFNHRAYGNLGITAEQDS